MSSLSAERKFFGRPQNEVPCDSSWLQHEVQARCPLCGVEGAKDAVLSTDHVLPEHPPVTLLRCPACGAAFLQDLTPDYESDMS